MNQPTGAEIMARARAVTESFNSQLTIMRAAAAAVPPIIRVAAVVGIVARTATEAYDENAIDGWREKMDAILAESSVKYTNLLVCESEDLNERRLHGQLLGRLATEFMTHLHENEAKKFGPVVREEA